MRKFERDKNFDAFSLKRFREMMCAKSKYDSLDFFEKFMRSDRGNQFMGYNYHWVFGSASSNYTAVNNETPVKESDVEYDNEIIYWMCGVYMCMCWNYDLTASECVDIISAHDLYNKFNPLHECGEKRSADKIMEIYGGQYL